MLQSTVLEFDLTKRVMHELDVANLQIDLQKTHTVYWFHCSGLQPEQLNQFATLLNLPESFLELCRENNLMPKLIDNQDNLIMQLQTLLNENPDAMEVEFGNLILYLTHNFCFTYSCEEIPAILHFREECVRALKYARSPCFIIFLMLDNIINLYSETLLALDMNAEQIDLQIRELEDDIYETVLSEEKKVMKIKRYAAALQEMLMRLSGRKIPVISEQCRLSLANLFDHSQIVVREAEAVRDSLKGSLSQIDNALMRRLNHTMRVLTAFAAIFLPLSLIAGVYGMNFHWMPELSWKYGYFIALGLMVSCGLGLFYLFKRNKWF